MPIVINFAARLSRASECAVRDRIFYLHQISLPRYDGDCLGAVIVKGKGDLKEGQASCEK